ATTPPDDDRVAGPDAGPRLHPPGRHRRGRDDRSLRRGHGALLRALGGPRRAVPRASVLRGVPRVPDPLRHAAQRPRRHAPDRAARRGAGASELSGVRPAHAPPDRGAGRAPRRGRDDAVRGSLRRGRARAPGSRTPGRGTTQRIGLIRHSWWPDGRSGTPERGAVSMMRPDLDPNRARRSPRGRGEADLEGTRQPGSTPRAPTEKPAATGQQEQGQKDTVTATWTTTNSWKRNPTRRRASRTRTPSTTRSTTRSTTSTSTATAKRT